MWLTYKSKSSDTEIELTNVSSLLELNEHGCVIQWTEEITHIFGKELENPEYVDRTTVLYEQDICSTIQVHLNDK